MVTLIYYLLSQYPVLSAWDSPLIAMVAIRGGLGHPPGYPLHTLLGMVMSHIPGLKPLMGVKLLSVIPGALQCIPILSIATQIHGRDPSKISKLGSWWAAAFVVALCIHPVLWDSSTRVEVYSLAAFLAVWGVARLGAAFGALNKSSKSAGRPRNSGFFIAGIALGASASVHPVVAAATASAAFVAFLKNSVFAKDRWRMILKVFAGGLIGLLPYLWIFVVAGRTDRFVWGAPTNMPAVWNFLRAKDFVKNVGPDASTIISQLFDWIGWSTTNGMLLFVAVGVAGWYLLGKKSALGRSGPIAIVLAVLAICSNKVWIPQNPDYMGYLCGPLAVCAAGGVALVSHLCNYHNKINRIIAGTCLILVLFVGFFAPPAVPTRTRYLDRSARLLALGALNESPKDGILIGGSDHLVWPLLYLQEVEHVRRDVVVISEGLAGLGWHWTYVYNQHRTLKPFMFNGAGRRVGRIQRFLKAHTDRPVAVESIGQIYRFGIKLSGVGWMLLDRPVDPILTEGATDKIEDAADAIGTGSQSGVGVLSLASYLRGHALWRLGQPKAAYHALLAGVPPSMRPAEHPPDTHWRNVPPLKLWIPPGLSTMSGMGDPHRNLSIAEYLVDPKKMEELKRLELHASP